MKTGYRAFRNEAEQLSSHEQCEELVHNFIDEFESKTGQWHGEYFHMITGEQLATAGDIIFMTANALWNLSVETGAPFELEEFKDALTRYMDELRDCTFEEFEAARIGYRDFRSREWKFLQEREFRKKKFDQDEAETEQLDEVALRKKGREEARNLQAAAANAAGQSN